MTALVEGAGVLTKSASEEKGGVDLKSARLEVLAGRRAGESIRLGKNAVVIGSDEAATFTCHDADVEWSHARIFKSKNRFHVEDLQSQGGVLVNDAKVAKAELVLGDVIAIGTARFRFAPAASLDALDDGAAEGSNGADGSKGNGSGRFASPGAATPSNGGATEDATRAARTEVIQVPDAGALLEAQSARVAASVESALQAAADGVAPAPSASGDPASGDMAHAEIAKVDIGAVEAAPVEDDLSQPATVSDLIPVIQALRSQNDDLHTQAEALREQNADLRVKLEAAELELSRKRTGLSLATESFVDQLERAKERISTFAKRHAETEALVQKREEELEKLKLEHEALQQVTGTRNKELCDKLESVRRDFDDLARVAASKGQQVAKTISEARMNAVGPSGSQALQTLLASAQAGGRSQSAGTNPAGGEDLLASRSGTGTGTRPISRAAIAVPGGLAGTSTAGSTAGALSASTSGVAAPGAPTAPAAPIVPPAPASALATALAPIRNILRSERVSVAAIFLIVAGAAFVIMWLFQMQPSTDRRARGASPPEVVGAPKPSAGASTTAFPPAGKPSAGASAGASTKPPASAAKPPVKTSQAPAAAAPTPSPAPQVAAAEGAGDDESGPIGQLRKAHRTRDEKAIKEAEAAIVAKGKDFVPQVKDAYEKERQFNVKVSLQFCLAQLEGQDSAQSIIDAMRASKAPDEKMRLAFMLGKLNKASDVPFLADAAQNEQDPMIKKYVVRALGNVEGAQGLEVLRQIAQGNQDRNLRIESIRAIEERGSAESETFLQDLTRNEQDASIKAIAVRALANTGGRSSMSYFQGVLDGDERTNNRAEAAKYMSRVGEPADISALEQAYQKEKVYYIRQKIRQSIETIQRRNGMDPTPAPPDSPDQGQPPQVIEPPIEEPK